MPSADVSSSGEPAAGATERLPAVVIACQVLQDLLIRLLPPGLAREVTIMDYGLHRVPQKMTWTLQEVIDQVEDLRFFEDKRQTVNGIPDTLVYKGGFYPLFNAMAFVGVNY